MVSEDLETRLERNAKRDLGTGRGLQVIMDSGLGDKIGSRKTLEGSKMDEVCWGCKMGRGQT